MITVAQSCTFIGACYTHFSHFGPAADRVQRLSADQGREKSISQQ